MRQIDADNLIERIKAAPIREKNKVIGLIHTERTAVRVGEWINRSLSIDYPDWEKYTCSACGKHSYAYSYCPNCGARMIEEREE